MRISAFIISLVAALAVAMPARGDAKSLELSGPRGTIISASITAHDAAGSTEPWSVIVEGADRAQVVLGFAAHEIASDALEAEIQLIVVVQQTAATSHATVVVRRGDRMIHSTMIVIHRTRDLADLNADGRVDSTDLTLMLAAWGRCGRESECLADLDGDGWVDGRDLSALVAAWQP